MSKKLSLLVAGALWLSGLNGYAQEVSLTVAEVLQRVATANADVAAAQASYNASTQGIEAAKAARLPEITAQLDLNYLGDGTILDRNFSNAMRDRLPHFGNTINVTLYQPVYEGGAINAGIDLAKQQQELAAIGVSQQTDATSIQALSAYFNLLKMHNLRQVYQENIAMTQRLIEDMTERYRQGTALRNDITRYELRLSSLNYDLTSIDNTISVLNHDLATLLGLPADAAIAPTEHVAVPEVNDEEYWQLLTLQRSNDLRAVDATKRLSETGLRLERAQMLPHVGIVIGDALTGPVTFEIPAIDKNYNAWFAGVSVKYSLSSLYKTNKKLRQKQLEIAAIDQQRTALGEALSRRVHKAYVDLLQAGQLLDTERVNVRLANENYQVVETRFNNDMALLTDMLDASTAKLDSEVRLVNANINRLLAYYQLKFISGTLNQQ